MTVVIGSAAVAAAAVFVPSQTVLAAIVAVVAIGLTAIGAEVNRRRDEVREALAVADEWNAYRRAILAEVIGHQYGLELFLDCVIPAYLRRGERPDPLTNCGCKLGTYRTAAYVSISPKLLGRAEFEDVVLCYELIDSMNSRGAKVIAGDVIDSIRALGLSIRIVERLISTPGVIDGAGPGLLTSVQHLADAKESYELFRGLAGLRLRHLRTLLRESETEDLRREAGRDAVDRALLEYGLDPAETAKEIARIPSAVRLDPGQRWRVYLRISESWPRPDRD